MDDRALIPAHPANNKQQFLKFASVGLAGTGFHYIVLLILVTGFGIAPGTAAFVGASLGACLVYFLNRQFTFSSKRSHAATIPRFAALAIAGALLNGLIVGGLSSVGVHFIVAQVLATGFVLFINFVVSKKWVFK